jgi:hypothetical protein
VSFHLDSCAGQLSLSNADWYKAVALAYQHGFKPPRKNPTLLKLEPFTLSPKVAAALQAALRWSLPGFWQNWLKQGEGSPLPWEITLATNCYLPPTTASSDWLRTR